MAVTSNDISAGIRSLGLSQAPVCVHSSLRSFGQVTGGAPSVVEGLLAEGCTVLVPTFSSEAYEVPAPPGVRLARNGFTENEPPIEMSRGKGVYTPDSTEVDSDMGAIPASVLATAGRLRSPHPIRSFAAIGPRAGALIPGGSAPELFGPLSRLAEVDGSLLLMGVDLDKLTAIHLAEQLAGRRMFCRWAYGRDGRPEGVEIGGCSDGFVGLEAILKPLQRLTEVGDSPWRAYPARELLQRASTAIRQEPGLTHCRDPRCVRCEDAISGGPVPAA